MTTDEQAERRRDWEALLRRKNPRLRDDLALKWLWEKMLEEHDVPASIMPLLFAARRFMQRDGSDCFPGKERIAKVTKKSVPTVKRWIRKAVNLDLLRVEHRKDERGRNLTNLYKPWFPEPGDTATSRLHGGLRAALTSEQYGDFVDWCTAPLEKQAIRAEESKRGAGVELALNAYEAASKVVPLVPRAGGIPTKGGHQRPQEGVTSEPMVGSPAIPGGGHQRPPKSPDRNQKSHHGSDRQGQLFTSQLTPADGGLEHIAVGTCIRKVGGKINARHQRRLGDGDRFYQEVSMSTGDPAVAEELLPEFHAVLDRCADAVQSGVPKEQATRARDRELVPLRIRALQRRRETLFDDDDHDPTAFGT